MTRAEPRHRRHVRTRVPLVLALACGFALGWPTLAMAQVSTRPGDTMWHISTRHLGSPSDKVPSLCVHQLDEVWRKSDAESLLQTDNSRVLTCVYVNEARVGSDLTVSRGFRMYQVLSHSAPAGQPLRLVIFSWPSPRTRRPLYDFRVTLAEVDDHGYYLGRLLSQMHPDVKVSLVGCSFGATVIAGALHVLAGGELAGQELSANSGPRAVRAAF